jgi:predicted small lipoprotein YifL
MSVVFRASAIVTALAATLVVLTLAGCGQGGPLYLPVAPPMPQPLPPEQGSAPAGTAVPPGAASGL